MTHLDLGGHALVAFSIFDGSLAYSTALGLGVNGQMTLRNLIVVPNSN